MNNELINRYQIGGSHYSRQYQPWDFFIDFNLDFINASAIKYIYRWRSKDGIKDLRKAIHFLKKSDVNKLNIIIVNKDNDLITDFVKPLHTEDAFIIRLIMKNLRSTAIKSIEELIFKYEDHDYLRG